jgi:hypothetical protein
MYKQASWTVNHQGTNKPNCCSTLWSLKTNLDTDTDIFNGRQPLNNLFYNQGASQNEPALGI